MSVVSALQKRYFRKLPYCEQNHLAPKLDGVSTHFDTMIKFPILVRIERDDDAVIS